MDDGSNLINCADLAATIDKQGLRVERCLTANCAGLYLLANPQKKLLDIPAKQ